MMNEKRKLLSLDVVYLIFSLILVLYYIEEKNLIDLLFLVVATIYYGKIKIYRWKKYH